MSTPPALPRVIGVLAVALSAGCSKSDGRPAVVPAGGRVVYNGSPVEGAVVRFTNPDANVSAYAMTGPDGRFKLTTFGHEDGAVPGRYRAAVSKVEVVARPGKPGVDYNASSEVPPAPEEKMLLPGRYGDPATSGLAFEVKPGDPNDFLLELK